MIDKGKKAIESPVGTQARILRQASEIGAFLMNFVHSLKFGIQNKPIKL